MAEDRRRTLLVLTDRNDLDGQRLGTFAACEHLTPKTDDRRRWRSRGVSMSGVASTGAPAEALSALRADTPPAAAAAAPRSLRDRITVRNDELDAGRPLSRGSVGTEYPKPPAAFGPDYFHYPGCSADAPWAFGGRSHPLLLRQFSAQGLDDPDGRPLVFQY